MGIIADLYNGKVYPFENISYSNHKGYKELLIKLEKLETSFLATLSSEDVQVYETLRNIQTDKECIELEQTFVYAFKVRRSVTNRYICKIIISSNTLPDYIR